MTTCVNKECFECKHFARGDCPQESYADAIARAEKAEADLARLREGMVDADMEPEGSATWSAEIRLTKETDHETE